MQALRSVCIFYMMRNMLSRVLSLALQGIDAILGFVGAGAGVEM